VRRPPDRAPERGATPELADPELGVLLDVASTHPGAERAQRARAAVDRGVDCGRLVDLAQRHGLVPLLHLHLGAPGRLPLPEHERLRALARESAVLNLALYAELHALLDELDAASIPVVPYKGPALAVSAYGNVGLREFRDLDLLVRREHVPRIKSILFRHGYQPAYDLTEAAERLHLRESCDYQFGRRRGRGVVEIHWTLLPRYLSAPMETAFWERLSPRPLGHRQVQAPAAEDLLLFLCAHAAKHAWERITWVTDVAELLRTETALDWNVLWRRARALRAERALRLGLFLAHRLLDAALPAELAAELGADPSLAALQRSVSSGWGRALPGRALRTGLFHLATRDDARDRLRYLALRATNLNAHDWSFVALPDPLIGLYYPLRLVRLGAEGLARLGAAFSGRAASPAR